MTTNILLVLFAIMIILSIIYVSVSLFNEIFKEKLERQVLEDLKDELLMMNVYLEYLDAKITKLSEELNEHK